MPNLWAFPEAIATSGASAAFDRLARDVVMRVGIACAALIANVIYLVSTLSASGAAGSIVSLYATLTTAVAVGACCALAPLVRREQHLRTAISKLEECIETLTEAEERARSFLDVQDDPIVRRDQDGRVIYANEAFCVLAGRRREEIIGDTYSLGQPQETVVVLPDGTRTFDQKLTTDAKPRWFTWRQVPLRSSTGERTETQCVGRDVTDRVRAEHAIVSAPDPANTASRAKNPFMAMLSDEIRTAMNSILGRADKVLDSKLTSEQAIQVRAIKTSAEALLALVEEIHGFSKNDARKLDLNARPLALATLVEDTVAFLSQRALAKGVEIASFVDERLPTEVVGDATRLHQVLLNALGHAVRSTSKGGVALVVEPGIYPDEVCFSVRRTGVGDPADAQGSIVEAFEQLDGLAAGKFGATGLGLAVSKRIVARMGGRVDRSPGDGSTFTFAVALPPTETAGVKAPSPDLTNQAVLIAASEQIEAQLIARRLAAWGARICIVADPLVAGALLPERQWDTVIVDRALGAAAVETIARACGRTTRRRLALIAPSDRDEFAALNRAGFTDYLVRPVRGASLAARFDAAHIGFEHREDSLAHRDQSIGNNARAILIATENDINALLARALLSKLGYRSSIATTGNDAVESWLAARAAGAPYDLVLMDAHTSDGDCVEAARQIRAAEIVHQCPRTPIIAMSANTLPEDRERCLAAGMDAFFSKPLDRERLETALAAVLKPAPPPRAAEARRPDCIAPGDYGLKSLIL